jgi:hypothetical protein
MVPLGIKLLRKYQNILGAIFHTESATLASLFDNMKFTLRNLELVDI